MTAGTILGLIGTALLVIVVVVLGGAVALEFSWWAVRMIFILSIALKRALVRLLISSTACACRWIFSSAESSLRFVGELLATAALALVMPPARRVGIALVRWRVRLQAQRATLLRPAAVPEALAEGPVEPALPSAAASLQTKAVEKPKARRTEASAAGAPDSDEYKAAVRLLGLDDLPQFGAMEFKLRYAQLKNQVSPDEGFPNAVFTEQVEAARATIRKVRGWA